MARLALVWVKQDGKLRVRQREQLRRAIAAASQFLGWAALSDDPLDVATRDLAELTRSGARTINAELADQMASKKTEMSQLKKTVTSIEKLAAEGDFTTPVEVSYAHTARRPSEDLVTKIEPLTLSDAQEARDAAQAIEKKLESWGRLRDQMMDELKTRKRRLEEMQGSLDDFVESSRQTVREVFITMP